MRYQLCPLLTSMQQDAILRICPVMERDRTTAVAIEGGKGTKEGEEGEARKIKTKNRQIRTKTDKLQTKGGPKTTSELRAGALRQNHEKPRKNTHTKIETQTSHRIIQAVQLGMGRKTIVCIDVCFLYSQLYDPMFAKFIT